MLLCLFLAGCRSANSELVEAELRTREQEVSQLKIENESLLRELGGMRKDALHPIPPELASQTYTLRQVSLGRGTGGWDDDKKPGDEALRLVLEPRDVDNHVIKAPGDLHVEVQEINPEGLKKPLSSWDVDARQLRPRWQAGFFSTGYVLIFPWKKWPTSERLRVIARFRLSDGRAFETERDITIHLPPGPPPELPGPALEEGPNLPPAEELPAPRKVISEKRRYGRGPDPAPQPAPPTGIQPAAVWQPCAPELDAVKLLPPVPMN